MALANCVVCGSLFLSHYEKHCKACSADLLEDSHKVKEYIAKHPWASVMEVYHKTGVKLDIIYGMMQRKRSAL